MFVSSTMANRFYGRLTLVFRQIQSASKCQMSTAVPPSSIHPAYLPGGSINVEDLFLSKPVQSLLRQLTGFEVDRIFVKKKKENSVPIYKLLTDAQLKEEYTKAMKKAEQKLQMPPVMKKRLPCEKVLRKDPEIQGLETGNIIFTDISFGYSDRKRPIVVREPNGVLRTATWAERERMLQTYLTRPERELLLPQMFVEPHLTRVLEKGWYEFVLDRACAQFEPDSEYFIGVTHRVYDHIRENNMFDSIHSTRHFGPMCLYFAVSNGGDELMLELLKENRLDDAAAYVKLFHLVHPDCRSRALVSDQSSDMDFVEAYVKLEAKSKIKLEAALQSYQSVCQKVTA